MITWGTLTWVLVVAAFIGGARWGMGRMRFAKLRAEVRADHMERRALEAERLLEQYRNLKGRNLSVVPNGE